MKVTEKTVKQAYQNVMELLVDQEIEWQLQRCPINLAQYINKVEVATYALNRLPPLYASSEKGKNQQKLIGYKKFKVQIKTSVRQGIAAVNRDPIRSSTPLLSVSEAKYQAADDALKEVENLLEERKLLDYQKLSWDNLASIIQRALNKSAWIGMTQESNEL